MSSNVRKWWSWPWDVGDGLGDLVTEALVSKGNYRVLERAQMKRIHRRGQDRRDRHIGLKGKNKDKRQDSGRADGRNTRRCCGIILQESKPVCPAWPLTGGNQHESCRHDQLNV